MVQSVMSIPKACKTQPSHFKCHCNFCMQYGDAFTLKLAGRSITFLFSPAAIQQFFSAPDAQIAFR